MTGQRYALMFTARDPGEPIQTKLVTIGAADDAEAERWGRELEKLYEGWTFVRADRFDLPRERETP